MAKKDEAKNITKHMGIAKQYIKYKGEYIAEGSKFEIEDKDVEELSQYADIKDVVVDDESAGEKDGEAKEGE